MKYNYHLSITTDVDYCLPAQRILTPGHIGQWSQIVMLSHMYRCTAQQRWPPRRLNCARYLKNEEMFNKWKNAKRGEERREECEWGKSKGIYIIRIEQLIIFSTVGWKVSYKDINRIFSPVQVWQKWSSASSIGSEGGEPKGGRVDDFWDKLVKYNSNSFWTMTAWTRHGLFTSST